MFKGQTGILQGDRSPQPGSTQTWGRRLLRWSPRVLGILVLVLLAFLGVDIVGGLKSLWHVRPEYFIPAFAVFCLGVLGRMATWVLVASSLKLGYSRVMSYVRVFLVGWFAGLGLPQGAASLTRLAVIAADNRSAGRGLVAVGVERVIQFAVMVALLVVSSIYMSSFTFDSLKWLILGIALVVSVALVAGVAILVGATRSLARRLRSYRRLRSFMEGIVASASELRRMSARRLACILGVALLAALLTVTALYLSSRALDIQIQYVVLITAWAAVGLTSLLPISINGLGPREGILVVAVAGVGLDSEGGVALGLLWFFTQAMTRLFAGAAWFTVLHARREPDQADLLEDGI